VGKYTVKPDIAPLLVTAICDGKSQYYRISVQQFPLVLMKGGAVSGFDCKRMGDEGGELSKTVTN
jgi:hypothetical protein